MIACETFYNVLIRNGVDFFTGVPDSLLKNFLAYVSDHVVSGNNVIAANEGGAVALAAGYHLATGKIPLVYMQNAGEGNAINPLASLVDPEVYHIPMLLCIGWRGEPRLRQARLPPARQSHSGGDGQGFGGQADTPDEPQHTKQGKITLPLLEALQIPYEVLPDSFDDAKKSLERAVSMVRRENIVFAFVVRKDTFEPYSPIKKMDLSFQLSREEAIKLVIDTLSPEDIVVASTGKIGRELFAYREKHSQGHERDFLTVGSMGHASQIALGIAMKKSGRVVYCLDGDGALIMHMGSLAIIGQTAPQNFKHVVLNNGAHDSVGGQPTAAFDIDIPSLAKACGYRKVFAAKTHRETEERLSEFIESRGPALLEIRINTGARENLGRPTEAPAESKKAFMKFVQAYD